MEKFGTRLKTRTTGNRPCRFCNAPNWSPIHKCPAQDSNCNNREKKRHYARVCKQRTKKNRTVGKLTEEEETEPFLLRRRCLTRSSSKELLRTTHSSTAPFTRKNTLHLKDNHVKLDVPIRVHDDAQCFNN